MPHVKHVRYTGTESIEIYNPTFKAQLEQIFNTRYIFSYTTVINIYNRRVEWHHHTTSRNTLFRTRWPLHWNIGLRASDS